MSHLPIVTLVCMPWASPRRPSIALGILARLCEDEGLPCYSSYANLGLTARLGLSVATAFADEVTLYGMSEHLFASDLFSPERLDSDTFLDVFARIIRDDPGAAHLVSPFADVGWLRTLRDDVIPAFLDELCTEILTGAPNIVGFTATFNQLMPSLALAGRLKKSRPDITIIAGGACFDGDPGPEIHRRFPWLIDHVFLGEAEDSFRSFVRARLARQRPSAIPGVTEFVDGDVRLLPGTPVADLDTSPRPDYRPYFSSKRRCESLLGTTIPVDFLPFESARGCWWGEKQQCTFCGINPEVMAFRGKTPARVVDDVLTLAAEHGITRFLATDWILSRKHGDDVFERFAAAAVDLDLFYEVRADLRKSQLIAMRRAGVTSLQPGIESFSTPMLKLMRKWTTGLRQVQFLRWCREIGIRPHYNLLHGMPGEREDWYEEMGRWLPALLHLDPPLHNLHPIEMHRFAPLFQERERYQVTGVQLRADYRAMFPSDTVDLDRVGYFHEYSTTASLASPECLVGLRDQIAAWLESAQRTPRPSFSLTIGPGFVVVHDERTAHRRERVLRGIERDLILLCDEVHSRARLNNEFIHRWPDEVVTGELVRVIDRMVEDGLLLEEDGHVLTLPIGRKPRSSEELRALVGHTQVASATFRLTPN